MGESRHIAFDLGAESGRTLLGKLNDGCVEVREINRFPNKMIRVAGHLHWNAFQLFEDMKAGMSACSDVKIDSVGVDTWGVDFALLDQQGEILGLPFSYRDNRAEGAVESFTKKMPREKLHGLTGLQILWVNTVYQLEAMTRDKSPLLEIATDLLFMPDLFHYLMTGIRKSEFSFATTSQLYNPFKHEWAAEVFETLGISTNLMQELVMPGTVIGPMLEEIGQETGLGRVPVVAVATHDTASAVAAIPAVGDDWAFISSGTWSIVGVLTDKPFVNETTLKGNFSNEGASEGNIRLLKNINALWMLQQCRKAWSGKTPISYDEITAMARDAEPFKAFVDPDCPEFANPPSMPEALCKFCERTGQKAPENNAAIARMVMESIALKYRSVIEKLRTMREQPINRIHIIGGGTKNELLNQFAANAVGVPVLTGPLEATAIGNLLLQAKAMGQLSSHDQIREVVRNSFVVKQYDPQGSPAWQTAYERFKEIEGKP
jgi:rhamnulokinase